MLGNLRSELISLVACFLFDFSAEIDFQVKCHPSTLGLEDEALLSEPVKELSDALAEADAKGETAKAAQLCQSALENSSLKLKRYILEKHLEKVDINSLSKSSGNRY
eukprot:gene21257-25543_t